MTRNYDVYDGSEIQELEDYKCRHRPIKAWTRGVEFEAAALGQLRNVAELPFIHSHVAVMPDVHSGIGATVGSVIATRGAVIPAAVGVDLGCGMAAVKISLTASQLPDNLAFIRGKIEAAVPHGRTDNGGRNDKGGWNKIPTQVSDAWGSLNDRFEALCDRHPRLAKTNNIGHLGTLGTGNHFIEVCLDTEDAVWVMLHSGSRGVGGAIGSHFIALAKEDMEKWFIHLPDKDLAYLPEGTEHFDQYVAAVQWAQDFALVNRNLMMNAVLGVLEDTLPPFRILDQAINCHHNYISRENHFGANVLVTRKGAVRARTGELGIIPGSMGAKSFIVRGLGNPDSFCSCSHGAGRRMSRTQAKKQFSLTDHVAATMGVECRKDEDVIDETPGAYKSIDAVMDAQKDLVEIVATLKQVLCVKG